MFTITSHTIFLSWKTKMCQQWTWWIFEADKLWNSKKDVAITKYSTYIYKFMYLQKFYEKESVFFTSDNVNKCSV